MLRKIDNFDFWIPWKANFICFPWKAIWGPWKANYISCHIRQDFLFSFVSFNTNTKKCKIKVHQTIVWTHSGWPTQAIYIESSDTSLMITWCMDSLTRLRTLDFYRIRIITKRIFDKNLSRWTEKPHLSHWEKKRNSLGERPPKGLQSTCRVFPKRGRESL